MPFDSVKTRIQSNSRHYDGMMDCAKSTLREEGILGILARDDPKTCKVDGETDSLILPSACSLLYSFQVQSPSWYTNKQCRG